MKWITWKNIGVDRMGCIWLIRRWIDPQAEFTFISNGEKSSLKDGEPFDIPGEHYSHHGGHCTFYALLAENKINDPILTCIAQIVDEADEVQEVLWNLPRPGLISSVVGSDKSAETILKPWNAAA